MPFDNCGPQLLPGPLQTEAVCKRRRCFDARHPRSGHPSLISRKWPMQVADISCRASDLDSRTCGFQFLRDVTPLGLQDFEDSA